MEAPDLQRRVLESRAPAKAPPHIHRPLSPVGLTGQPAPPLDGSCLPCTQRALRAGPAEGPRGSCGWACSPQWRKHRAGWLGWSRTSSTGCPRLLKTSGLAVNTPGAAPGAGDGGCPASGDCVPTRRGCLPPGVPGPLTKESLKNPYQGRALGWQEPETSAPSTGCAPCMTPHLTQPGPERLFIAV